MKKTCDKCGCETDACNNCGNTFRKEIEMIGGGGSLAVYHCKDGFGCLREDDTYNPIILTINGHPFTAYRTRRPSSLPEYFTGRGPAMCAQWVKLNGGHWPVFWNEPKGTGYYFEWRKAWYRLPFLHGNEVIKLGYLQEVTLTEN